MSSVANRDVSTDESTMLSTLVTILCVVHLTNAESSTVSKTFKYPETQILTNNLWYDTAKLVYTRCNTSEPDSGKRCIVGLNLDVGKNSSDNTATECKISLKPETSAGRISDVFWVYGFDNDKAILIWIENHKDTGSSNSQNKSGPLTLKTSVIHVLDNCRVFEGKVHKYDDHPIDFNCLNLNVIVFDNSYELTLKNVTNNCKPGNECNPSYAIFKFDAQAERLSGPENWPAPIFNNETAVSLVTPVEPGNPIDGYFIVNHDYFKLVTYMITKESHGK